MTRKQRTTPSRRTVLSGIGAGLATSLIGTGAAATQSDSQYVLVQDGECVPVQPIRGDSPAEAFYDYQLPEQYVSDENGATGSGDFTYASAGTQDLQRAQTSIAFLYEGPEGLSLVFVHGSVENDDAGSVTFEIAGLPEDGEWIVKDDLYRNPDTGDLASTNYDRWDVDGTDHQIDWTWGSAGTDGGVFRALGDDFEVIVQPAFNEAATLYDEYYEGTVTDWEFLSGDGTDVERVSLDLEEPILIATGRCEDVTGSGGADRQTDRDEETEKKKDREVEQEQNVDVEQEQNIDADEDVKTEQHQEVETEQRQETNEEQRTTEEEKEDEDDEDEKEAEDENDEGKEEHEKDKDEKEDEDKDEKEDEDDEKDDEDDEEDEKEDKKDDEDDDRGNGEGHKKGRGKGHEKGQGRGHEKHDDDDDDD